MEADQIILGIDPGTTVMGYGLIGVKGKKTHIIQFGVIHLKKYANHEIKLRKIFEKVSGLIHEFSPDHVALEAPFYGKNVQSMLKLGRAQGVAMAAALSMDIPISEYAPKRVKQSVAGNGNASKEQVAEMLRKQLRFETENILLDATDALAVALCHYHSGNDLAGGNKKGGWSSFLKNNPGRIKGGL